MNKDIKKIELLYTNLLKEGMDELYSDLQTTDELYDESKDIESLVTDEFLNKVMDSLNRPSMKLGILLIYIGMNIMEVYTEYPQLKKVASKTVVYENIPKANQIIKTLCHDLLLQKSKYVDNQDLTKLRISPGVKLTNHLISWAKSIGLEYLIGTGNFRKYDY